MNTIVTSERKRCVLCGRVTSTNLYHLRNGIEIRIPVCDNHEKEASFNLGGGLKHISDIIRCTVVFSSICGYDERDAERLKQVAELAEENERLRDERDVLDMTVKDLRGRNKGLQRVNESLAKDIAELETELGECVQIKADTVRKMQKRLKAQKFTHKNFGELVYVEDIDQIAKEMLEDNDGKNG